MNITKPVYFTILLFLGMISASSLLAQPVISYSGKAAPINQRWDWAQSEALKTDISNGYWIAYSIIRKTSHSAGIHHHGYGDKDIKSIGHLLYNDPSYDRHDDHDITGSYRKINCDEIIEREMVYIFKMNDEHEIVELSFSDLYGYFIFEEIPLFWLKLNDQTDSFDFLQTLYKDQKSISMQEDLISAIGLHLLPEKVIPFLKDIIDSDVSNTLREESVFWLSMQNDDSILDYLIELANNDRSDDVRENAVFAISLIKTEKATDTLIDLAKNSRRQEIRKKAIFWLGQKASKKALPALEEFVYDSEETDIQKSAVFALSQLDHEDAVPKLIRVAETHPNPAIRKKAIFWLGNTEDDRALDAIIKFIKK